MDNAEQDEESSEENLRISKNFTEPEYAERTDYDIITKQSVIIMDAERENLVKSTNINSNMNITSDFNITISKYSEDESVDTKYDIPELKVEIKKKASPVNNNDLTEIKFNENNTKTQSRIPILQERADNALYTGSVNDFVKDDSFVIDDGKGDNRIIENGSTSLTNTNKYPAAASKKNIIYRKFRSFFLK